MNHRSRNAGLCSKRDVPYGGWETSLTLKAGSACGQNFSVQSLISLSHPHESVRYSHSSAVVKAGSRRKSRHTSGLSILPQSFGLWLASQRQMKIRGDHVVALGAGCMRSIRASAITAASRSEEFEVLSQPKQSTPDTRPGSPSQKIIELPPLQYPNDENQFQSVNSARPKH